MTKRVRIAYFFIISGPGYISVSIGGAHFSLIFFGFAFLFYYKLQLIIFTA